MFQSATLKWCGILSIAATGWMTSSAKAAPLALVDLQVVDANPTDNHPTNPSLPDKSGAAAIGSATDTWNQVGAVASGGFTTAQLATTTGVPTSVTISLTSGNGSFNNGSPNPDPLLEQYVGGAGSTTGSINGLTPGASYDIYLYGTNGRGTVGSTFTVNGDPTSQTASGQPSNSPPYVQGVDYVVFTGQVAAGGTIPFTVSDISGMPGDCCFILDGIQIQGQSFPAPEPTCFALTGLAGIGLLVRRRRA